MGPIVDHRVRCDECGRDIPERNLLVHRAACRRRRQGQSRPRPQVPDGSNERRFVPSRDGADDRDGSDGGGGAGLSAAYILWAFIGGSGVHHAYLGRPYQALGWFATYGLFGLGLIRDFFLLPYYGALAQDDRIVEDMARIRASIVEARGGVPSMSVTRMALMGLFGTYFGFVASCLVELPEGMPGWAEDGVYGTLRAVGAAAGVWLVGNMGEETLSSGTGRHRDVGGAHTWVRLVASCLAGSAVLDSPNLFGIAYATWCRRYRPSMRPTDGPSWRIGRHLLACSTFAALVVLAIYNHGGVVVNGHKIYIREAVRNAWQSDFWQEFDFDEFRERSRTEFGDFGSSSSGRAGRGRGRGGTDYLKHALDLEGERVARRTLGVGPGATHAEVRKMYKGLALKFHPDKVGSDATEKEVEEAHRRFVALQEAYEVLDRIEKRRKKREGSTLRQRRDRTQEESSHHGYEM